MCFQVGEERKWETIYEGYMLAVPLRALPPGMHLFRLRACPADSRVYSRFSPVRAALIIGILLLSPQCLTLIRTLRSYLDRAC